MNIRVDIEDTTLDVNFTDGCYLLEQRVDALETDVTDLENDKVDKVSGKELIATTKITKLDGIDENANNYDDTEVRNLIANKAHTSLTNLNDDSDNQHITETQVENLDQNTIDLDYLTGSPAIANMLAEKLALSTDIVVSKCILPIRMLAGVMDFEITGASNLKWYFPDGTTSTAERPAKTLSSDGVVYAVCDDFSDSVISIKDNGTDANYVGTIKDITYFTNYANFGNTAVTGDVGDIKATNNVYFYNTGVTGDLSGLHPITSEFKINDTTVYGAYTQVNGTNVPTTTDFSNTSISATDMDSTLIAYAACTKDNGSFTATGMTRTSASDAAVATLTGRGWTISGLTTV